MEVPSDLQVTPALLAAMPSLLVVATYGAGFDTIDVPACTRAGVAAFSQSGGNAEAVAEHAIGMMIALLKRFPQAMAAVRTGAVSARADLIGNELLNRTVGLVGLGHIGARVAAILQAFGCRVLAFDSQVDAETCARRGVKKVEFGELLTASDIVSVHCPMTSQTRGLFDAHAFATMRPGAIFINTARGGIHDEAALYAALASGQIGGAGLDVWDREPPPKDHPLLSHPAVLPSPHIGGVTHESRDRVARMAAEVFIAVAAGQVPPRLLNPEVVARLQARLVAPNLARAPTR